MPRRGGPWAWRLSLAVQHVPTHHFVLVFGLLGIACGLNRAEMSMWLGQSLLVAGIVAVVTGGCTLAVTAIALRDKDRDLPQDLDVVGLIPPNRVGWCRRITL